MWGLFAVVAALAGEPAVSVSLAEGPAVILAILADGSVLLDDRAITDAEIATVLVELTAGRPDLGVRIAADAAVPYGRVVEILDAVREAGVLDVGLAVGQAERPPDPLFPGAGGQLEKLGTGLTKRQLDKLEPKRWKFPQDPYGTTDFTAYTQEWGGARIGVATVAYGLLPRMQIGTAPVLDGFGAYNAQVKFNLMREGPLDGAVHAEYYLLNVNDLVQRVVGDKWNLLPSARADNQNSFVLKIGYLNLGWTSSLQVVGGWSIHGGVAYNRATATGSLDMLVLPDIIAPGLDPAGDGTLLVSDVVGEFVEVRFATDYRFNRRDSVIFQFSAPVYARVHGGLTVEQQQIDGLKAMVSYGKMLPIASTYRASIAYQASWKRWDLRLGIGKSAIPYTWLEQSVDLAYRFGGKTRHVQSKIERGFRLNTRDLRHGGDASDASSAVTP